LSSLIETANRISGIPSGPPKILFIDVERIPGEALAFETKIRGGYIPAKDFVSKPRSICFAAKWYDDKRAKFFAEWDEPDNPDYFAQKSWELFEKADIVVTYYGTGADIPWFKATWLKAGLGEPSPFIHVDLYYTARQFGLLSSSLSEVCGFLGLPGKNGAYDKWEAIAAANGDEKARKKMRKYNVGDVGPDSLEGVFDIFRPYLKVNLGHWFDGDVCTKCGSDNIELIGIKRTGAMAYEAYRCTDCKGLSKGKRAVSSAGLRGL
jgi:RNase_H superfamily